MINSFNIFKIPFRAYSPLIRAQNNATFHVTDSAFEQLKVLRQKFPLQALRIAVESGGCHGFQYKFSLTPSQKDSKDDLMFEEDKSEILQVVCDKISWDLLKDAKLDYSRELIGSSFRIIDNPVADSGCGCGVSFDLKSNK